MRVVLFLLTIISEFFLSILLIVIIACVSFNKKSSNNAQGGQPRVNPTPVNSAESNYASAARTIPNGTNVQPLPQFHGKHEQHYWFLVCLFSGIV